MHYTRYELDQYRCGAMSCFRRLSCRFHLRHCRRCRKRLMQLSQDDILIAELRRSEQQMKIPENLLEYRKLCDIFQEDENRQKSTV